MKYSSIVFCASVVASILVLGSGTSHAQSAWRCQGEDCQDGLISDIEDLSVSSWPASQTLAVPPISYFCRLLLDRCPHCAIGEQPASPGDTPEQAGSTIQPRLSKSGTVPWSIVLSGSLRSFLVGRFSASADVFGTIQSTSDNSVWPGTEAGFVFQDACDANGMNCTDVRTSSGGDTGVVDLGPLSFSPNLSGSFWNGSLTFRFTVPTNDIITGCDVGYGGLKIGNVQADPNNVVTVSFPVAWTPVASVIEQAVRAQFRRAASIAVTGSP